MAKRARGFPVMQPGPQSQSIQQPRRVLPRQVPTGTGRGQQSIGENNIRIENDNARIIINDGSNDRVLLGKQVGGF